MPNSKKHSEQNLCDFFSFCFFCAKKPITSLEFMVKQHFILHYSHSAAKILAHFKSLASAPPSMSFQDGLLDTFAPAEARMD